ncbi:MAG: hypothetical protein QXI11_02565 [Thermoproteota archaeon]
MTTLFNRTLRHLFERIRRARKLYKLSPICRAFINAYIKANLKIIRSITLIKAIINAIKEMKHVLSVKVQLISKGISDAWKLSMLATAWGHSTAYSWRYDMNFIIYCGLTASWIFRLFASYMV